MPHKTWIPGATTGRNFVWEDARRILLRYLTLPNLFLGGSEDKGKEPVGFARKEGAIPVEEGKRQE